MAWPPTTDDFRSRFDRDFVYGTGKECVRELDITNALADALPLFNTSLWSSSAQMKTAFLFLSAHLLVLNLQAAGGPSSRVTGKGAGNTGGGVIQSKSVGSVSLNYTIPESLANSRILSQFLRTDYGQRYLHMMAPRLVGNVSIARGPGIDDEPNSQT